MSQATKWEVLFVSHKYPPATGGMEKQSYELIHGVSHFTKVHKLVYRKGSGSVLSFFFHLNHRILKILKENPNIKLIHFNDGLIASLALFHKGYSNYRKVVTLHGLDVVFPWAYFQKKILPRFNQFYDKIITVSHATAKAAIDRGIYPDLIRVIQNGVDLDLAQSALPNREELHKRYPEISPDQPYMLTLGRPVKRKGFSWLLREVVPLMPNDFKLYMIGPFNPKASFAERCMSLLPKKFRHLLNLFLGYPSDEAAIRKLLKQPDIASKVQHLGKVPFSDLKLLLANSSAFLMPNIEVPGDMEGFGLVCLEASLSGSLVLASGIEGITDAIRHQQNGLLLPSKDVLFWKQQLTDVMQKELPYQIMAKKFQEASKKLYSWEKMSTAYFEVFHSLVQDEGPHTASSDALLAELTRGKDSAF